MWAASRSAACPCLGAAPGSKNASSSVTPAPGPREGVGKERGCGGEGFWGSGVGDAAPGSCLESCCDWRNGEAIGFLWRSALTRQCPSTGPAPTVPNP